MRLKEALSQEQRTKANIYIYEKILKECQPYLKLLRGQMRDVVRGHKSNIRTFSKRTVRTDRQPLETDRRVHDLADKIFYKEFKLKPRSQGVFTFSDLNISNTYYGRPLYFYPIGKVKYIWSPKYQDFTLALMDEEYLDSGGRLTGYGKEKWEEVETFVDDMVQTYRTDKLHEALKTRHEIIWFCKEYYLVNQSYHIPHDHIEEALKDMKEELE